MRLVRAGAYATALVAAVGGAARLRAQTYFGQNQVQYDRFKWSVTETGRRARFYRLTRSGRAQLAAEQESWARLTLAVRAVMGS